MVVSSIPQHHQTLHNSKRSYTSSQHVDRYHMKFKEFRGFHHPTESVHGLICFHGSETPIVWNPSTRQFLTLPKPGIIWDPQKTLLLLGYDPIEGKHKVVCKSFSSSDVCRVLTLGSAQKSWRTVEIKHIHSVKHCTSGRCIKGVVYYLAYVSYFRNFFLMSFDVQSEKFNTIQIEYNICEPLIAYKGRVACVGNNWENHITLYILEDAEEGKWSVKRLVAPIRYYDHSLNSTLELKSMTHAGEFIYAPCSFRKSGYILFCDSERNSFRRFELKLFNNGVVRSYSHQLHVFPNHVESQMSL